MDIDRSRPEAHLVITGLESKFARHDRGAGSDGITRRKMRLDCERASKDGQQVLADLNVFRLRIGDGSGLERSGLPCELEWNQKLIFRLVAVHVKTRKNVHVQGLRNTGRTSLNCNAAAGIDSQLILLCVRQERQKEAAKSAEQRLPACRRASSEFR